MDLIQKHVLQRKDVSAMSERELLMELVEEKRKLESIQLIRITIQAVILLVLLFLVLHYGPPVYHFFKQLNDSVNHINTLLDDISSEVDYFTSAFDGLFRLFGN